jgi:hypothetical protein
MVQWILFFASFLLIASGQQSYAPSNCMPFGTRLNLGLKFYDPTEDEMLGIMFDTHDPCEESFVVFERPASGSFIRLSCDTTNLTWGNETVYTTYVHKCHVYLLEYGERFSYMVYGWSGNTQEQPTPF